MLGAAPYFRDVKLIRLLAWSTFCASAASAVHAQCPDGTPPPCATARVASAARRTDPPLNDRTWIVVPFNNVTRAPDVEWMRDASVNLLYLDLSQWQDIHVIDDARVADLVRQIPEARTVPLSLDAATAMARRAGAGRLVMGSFIKQGSRTTLAARVFDVRRNVLVRSAQQDLTAPDSLMPVFGRLARGILDVAAPMGVAMLSAGTTRVDAYQEYLAGTKALNRFDLIDARPHFEQALKLDSTFALAHYKLGVVIGWQSAADTTRRQHAAAAERLSGSLPARERAIMKGFNAFEHAQYGSACDTYGALVRADSSDVEALYGLGECSFHDPDVVSVGGGTGLAFRGSHNAAIRAFQRTLDLDPTYHLAFQHILDALRAEVRSGANRAICPTDRDAGPRCTYAAYVRRDHDTLVMAPVLASDTAALAAQAADYVKTDAKRKNLEQALATAKAWVASAPDESRARVALGDVYTQLSDAAHAEDEFAQVRGKLIDRDAATYLIGRAEALMKLGRTEQLRRILDSAIASKDRRGDALPQQLGILIGRFAPIDSARPTPKGTLVAYRSVAVRALMTGGNDVVAAVERAYVDSMRTTPSWTDAFVTRHPMYALTLRMPRTWPPSAFPESNRRGAIAVAVARGDTARLRAEARSIDSILRSRPTTIPDSGASIVLADAFLVLHDSTSALRVVQRALDSTWLQTPMATTPVLNGLPVIVAWPRLALMRADLEASVGSKAVAREWYRRFVDLWTAAEPEFAPMLNRARKGLAATGGR